MILEDMTNKKAGLETVEEELNCPDRISYRAQHRSRFSSFAAAWHSIITTLPVVIAPHTAPTAEIGISSGLLAESTFTFDTRPASRWLRDGSKWKGTRTQSQYQVR